LIDFIRSLRNDYRIGLLSNAWTGTREALTNRFSFLDAFDVTIFSAEVGLKKPDPKSITWCCGNWKSNREKLCLLMILRKILLQRERWVCMACISRAASKHHRVKSELLGLDERETGRGRLSSAEHQDIIRIGVVADTHVPDRARSAPGAHSGLADRGVSQICTLVMSVFQLFSTSWQQIAPVTAVGGNRDWWFGQPAAVAVRFMDIAGISIALVHGHGGFLPYFKDKWYYLSKGTARSVI
jgi:hypothetical protein